MNAKIITLSLFATLASAFAASSAHATTCNLPIVGTTHMLEVLSTGEYVQTLSFEGWVAPLTPTSQAAFNMVPGLSDPSMISLESATYPGYFLAPDLNSTSNEVQLLWNDGSAGFKAAATFDIMPGLSTNRCDYRGISLRLAAAGNLMYLTRSKFDGRLIVTQIAPNQVVSSVEAQTFAVVWE